MRLTRTNHIFASTKSLEFRFSSVQAARSRLAGDYPSLTVPKCKPLSPGEVLGCTAPVLTAAADAIVFVADGRFHLEAIMIANPSIPAYRRVTSYGTGCGPCLSVRSSSVQRVCVFVCFLRCFHCVAALPAAGQ